MVKIEFSVKMRRPISDRRCVVKIDIAKHTDYGQTTVDSGNSKRLNSKQSLISKHF